MQIINTGRLLISAAVLRFMFLLSKITAKGTTIATMPDKCQQKREQLDHPGFFSVFFKTVKNPVQLEV